MNKRLDKNMNKNLEILLDALKSGEYTQTRSVLHDADGGMCCMGVACDLFIDGYWREKENVNSGDFITNFYTIHLNGHTYSRTPPTRHISKVLGVSEKVIGDLIRLNDWDYEYHKRDYGPVIAYIEDYLMRSRKQKS